jgi:beta-lactamase superfamily II metal-dependent hydrolase
MGYEVDFLAVGEGEKSGDAIALRYGNLFGERSEQHIITIDGGNLQSGDELADHVIKHYKTEIVDIAILTHPDNDHASGIRRVLERLTVKQLVMHLPWNHSSDVLALISDDRVSANSLTERAKRNLRSAKEAYDFAVKKGIPVFEPFAGAENKTGLIVLGPTKEFYQRNLANFRFNPGTEVETSLAKYFDMMRQLGEKVARLVTENWWTETLKEPAEDATTPENNSSVILLLHVDGKKLLFSGDAGVPALTAAVDFADARGISLGDLCLLQVPHHGSRRNLGPTILNRILGEVRSGDTKERSACVSAAKDATRKHPHKKVTNALRRRGVVVKVTGGKTLRYSFSAPERTGWVTAEAVPFYSQVEDDD